MGSNPHNPFLYNFFFHGFFELTMRLSDPTPKTSLYFSFSFPFRLEVVRRFPRLTLKLDQEVVGLNPSPLISYFQTLFSSQDHGSNSLHHIPFYFFIFVVLNMVRSRVQSSMTSLVLIIFFTTS